MKEKTIIKPKLWKYSLVYNDHDNSLMALNLELRCIVKEGKKRREVFTTLEIPEYTLMPIIKKISSDKN